MFFFFTCGSHMFSSLLKGYENITVQCQNCGNFSAKIFKRWHWFTFCFVPVIPFSIKPDHEVGCHICNFYQDIKFRPDVQTMMDNSQGEQQIPMNSYGGPPPPSKAAQGPPQYI